MPNQLVVETLAESLTGSSPRDWNDRGKYLYEFNLEQTINYVAQMFLFMSDDRIFGSATLTTIGPDRSPIFDRRARQGKIV